MSFWNIFRSRHKEEPPHIIVSKEAYLFQCGALSAQDLTDEQLLTFFSNGHDGVCNKMSANTIICGKIVCCEVDRPKALSMLRRAFDEDKDLKIFFSDGEGVDDGTASYGYTHVEYILEEKIKE